MDYEQIVKAVPNFKKREIRKKDLQELPGVLQQDESIENMIGGFFYPHGTGAIAATNKRVLYIRKRFFGQLLIKEFPYETINSIQYKKGFASDSMTIYSKIGDTIYSSGTNPTISTGNNVNMTYCPKGFTEDFSENVRTHIEKQKQLDTSQPSAKKTSEDKYSQLEKLGNLLERKIISQQEFDTEKAKILGRE